MSLLEAAKILESHVVASLLTQLPSWFMTALLTGPERMAHERASSTWTDEQGPVSAWCKIQSQWVDFVCLAPGKCKNLYSVT